MTWSLSLKRLYVLTAKELIQFFRDRILLIAAIYLFTVDVFMAASGVQLTLHNASLGVFDMDHSKASRELISRFRDPYFNFKGYFQQTSKVFPALDSGKLLAYLEIPDGFEEAIEKNQRIQVQLLVDTSNSVMGYLVAGYGAQIVSDYALDMMLERLGMTRQMLDRFPIIRVDRRSFFNPNEEEAWFISVAELLSVITMLTMLLPAAALVREKERGTIEQLLVSPVSPLEVLLSKILAMTVVILMGTCISVGFVIEGIFHVPIRTDLWIFFVLTAFYVFTACGYGLFIGALARNLAQVGLMTIIGIAPMVFLSGTWTPPEAMPLWLRSMMIFSPLHYYIEAVYGLFLKGVDFQFLWPKFMGIALLGAGVLIGSLLLFRRQFR